MNNLLFLLKCSLIFPLSGILFSCSNTGSSDYLKQGFLNPPDSARPGVYWYFMDGNIDRGAITADLESMKNAGIGYVLFLEVNVGVPRGKVDFLSEEWQEFYKHAVKEAERLGIRIILGSGPGWAGSGGPWVIPSQSMMHLVASDTIVKGPSVFNGRLPIPKPKKPFFGEGSLTQALRQQRENWYEDEFVLAFPASDHPAIINGIEEKALYYRAPYTSQPGVLPYLPAPATYHETGGSVIDQKNILDLTDKLSEDGTLNWIIPDGKWTIMRFGKRNNGAVTRPAPQPGLGFECDKFDTASFDAHYDAFVGKLIRKVLPQKAKTGGGWTMIHIDSWEMGAQNWSPGFRDEFKKRRGYDPLLFLPVFTGLTVASHELSERFLWDVRQTSGELIVENHAGRFKELGRKNGFRLSIEPYDMNPASDLDLGAVADVPMCEFWSDGYGFNSAFSCVESTSIAHVSGAPVIAAEAFTANSNEAWKKYPGDMKNQGDWAFCMGINRLIYHTFAHKPYGDQFRPGMTMGPYGVHWDRGQTWWPMAFSYHKYITRCQYILSQGKPVADILYLAAEGAPHVFLPPSSALEGTSEMPDKRSFSFDGCSPLFLIKYASVKDGQIVFPGGASYRVLVLPDVQTMTPELVNKIKTLAEAGAKIIGNPPLKSPSLTGFPMCDDIVTSTAIELWGNNEIPARLTQRIYGDGAIWWGKELYGQHRNVHNDPDSLTLYPDYDVTRKLLVEAGIKPDFTASGNIRYAHRSLPDREIYFISNRKGEMVTDTCWFRDGSPVAEAWDAITGEIRLLKDLSELDGVTCVPVSLEPFESYFIVFYDSEKTNSKDINEYENFPEKQILMTLNGPWNVAFDTSWGGPEKTEFKNLDDWSKRPEDGIRYYSGTAVYSKTFDLPDSAGSIHKSNFYLDLGNVKNIARVRINKKDLGVVWTSPWQVKISDAVKKTKNHLEIEVANLWINRLIGDESEPWDGIANGKWPEWFLNGTSRPGKRYTFTTHRYYKKSDILVESGLLGPVTIERSVELP
ncbi:MAG: glycosyl hydrolase [Bacteroidales bacterium]|nr:glycosyl hydrolase [Bacteroidales bacterium]